MRVRTLVFPFLVLAVGLLAGCPPPQEATPPVDLAAEQAAVRAQSAQWMAWAQAKDAASIAEGIFLEDAVTMFDDEIHRGRAAIQASMEEEFASAPDSTITWSTDRVAVAASGDLAYELGSWTFDPDGDGEAPATRGEYVTVWTKVDGVWRCAVDAGAEYADEEDDEEDEG